jgi:hypothetical protein
MESLNPDQFMNKTRHNLQEDSQIYRISKNKEFNATNKFRVRKNGFTTDSDKSNN